MAKNLNVSLAFTANTNEAIAAIKNLQKELNGLATGASLKNSGIAQITPEIQKAMVAAGELQAKLESATNLKTGKLDLGQFNDSLKKGGVTLDQYAKQLNALGPAGRQAFTNLAQSIIQAEAPLIRCNKRLKEFGTTIANTARWQVSSSILHGFMGTLQSAYGYAQDLNESLNNIRIVTGSSTAEMAEFAKEANKAARALSTTTTAYTDASLIFYQQGLNKKEVQERADIVTKMANVTREAATEVSNQLTAIWSNFDDGTKSLEYYADVLTKLGAETASSTDEIAGGLEKFAAVAETIGLSYEYAASTLATITANTRQSEEVVGTALKTIFARIQGLNLGETLDDGTTLNKYSDALQKVGISIFDQNGELKKMDSILDEMGEKWSTLSNAQQTALAQTVAGVRQYNQLMSLMNEWDSGDSDSMQANLKYVAEAEGTLSEQSEIYAESWEAARDRVTAAAEELYSKILDDEFFIDFLGGIEKAIDGVSGLVDAFGGLDGVLLTIGTLVTRIFQKEMMQGMHNVAYTLKQLTPLGKKEQEERKQEAIKSLNNLRSTNDGFEGQAENAALKREIDMQEKLKLAVQKVSEEELKSLQIQMDTVRAMDKRAAAAAKLADAAKKELEALQDQNRLRTKADAQIEARNKGRAEAGKTMLNNALGEGGMDDKKAVVLKANDLAEQEIRKKYNLDENQSLSKYEDEIALELVKQIKNAMKDLKIDNDEIEQALNQEISEKVKESLSKVDTQQLGADVDNYQKQVEKSGSLYAQGRAMSDLRTLSIKNSQGEIDEDEMANVYKQLKIRIDEAKASAQALLEAVDQDEEAKAAVDKLTADINEFESELEAAKDDAEELEKVLAKLNSSEGIGEKIQETAFEVGSGEGLIAETANQGINQESFDLTGQFEAAAHAETEAIKFRNASADAGDSQDNLNKKFEKAQVGMNDWATSISNATSLIMGVGAAVASVQGAIDTFNDPDASAWDKVSAIFGVLISVLPLASTLMTTFGTTTAAAGATAGAGMTAALGPVGIVIGVIVAAIAGLTLAFSALQKAYNKDAINAKKAAENAEKLAEGAEKAKNALEGLKAGFEAYDTAVDKLEKCVKGTDEWNAALAEVNDTVLDLLNTYPELLGQKDLFTRNRDGMLEIDSTKQKEIIEQAEKAADAAEAAALVSKARAAEASAVAQNTQVSRNIGSFYSYGSQGEIDATVNAGQIMTANKELLSGLTPEEFEKELRNLIVKPAGMLDSEYEAMVSKLLGYQSSIDSLVTATENAATQMNNATLILANEVLGNEYGATEKAAAAQAYEEEQDRIYQDIIDLDAENNSKDMKTSTTAQDIWDRFQAATGITYELSENAIRGTDDNRTYAYKDETGKDQTYTIEYIAQTIAASEAMAALGTAAEDAQKMLGQLSQKGTAFAAALGSGTDESSMANFLSGLTQQELDAFQAGITTDENGNTVLSDEALAAIGLTADQFEQLATTFGISVTDLTNNLVNASEDVDQSGFSDDISRTYANQGLDVNNMSIGEQQEFLNNRNAFSKNFTDVGTYSDFSGIIKENANLGAEVLSDFMGEMSLLNPLAEDSGAQIQALAEKYGIQGTAIEGLIQRTDALDKQYNISTANIKQNAQTLKEIVGEGFETGEIISEEDFSALQQAGIDVDNYFTQMADGTYALTGSVEDFNRTVNQLTFDSLKAQIDDFDKVREQATTGEWFDKYLTDTSVVDATFKANSTGAYGNLGTSADDLGRSRLDYINSFEDGSFDFNAEQFALLDAYTANPELNLTSEQLQIIADMIDVVNAKEAELSAQALITATSYDDLQQKVAALGQVTSIDYGNALVQVASQHANCTEEIAKYQEALLSGDSAQIEAATSALELSTMIGDTAVKYGLNADELEDYSKRLKDMEGNENLSAEGAVKLAAANMRLDKGVSNLKSNLTSYRTALKNSNKGSAEWSKTLTALKDDLADIANVADGSMLSDSFAEDIASSELLEKALNGDSDAILELRTLAADDIIANLDVDDSALETVNEQWNYLKANMAAGVSAEGVDQSKLIDSFNEMIEAGNMTKDQIEAALSGLNVSANIVTTYHEQETQVPTYTEVMEPNEVTVYDDEGTAHTRFGWTKYTIPGPPKTVMGSVPTYSIEGTEGEGGSTVAFEKLPAPKASSSATGGNGGGGGSSSKPAKGEKERYHVVNKKIDKINRDQERASANKDQAFGRSKLKYIDEEIKAIENLQKAYAEYYDEIANPETGYLAQDLKALQDLGLNVTIEDGIITNWDEIIDAEKAAFEEVMNGEYVSEASKEAAQQRWDEVNELIKQYESTVEELEKVKDLQAEAERNRISKELEKITTEVEFEIEINQRDLDKLEYIVDKLGRNVNNMIEMIDKLGTQVDSYQNQSNWYAEGINRIKANAAAEGRELTDEEQRKIWEYEDALLSINNSLMDLVETVENSVMEEFNRLSEEIQENIDRFDTYNSMLDHYNNIIKLSGRQTKDSMLLMKLSAQQTDIAMEKLNATNDKYLAQQEAQKDAAEKLANARRSGNQADIDYWEKQYEEITKAVEESHDAMLGSWEEVLQAASDQFDLAIELTIQKLKDAISEYGLDGLADRYEKAKTVNEQYLSQLDKEYELNKLIRQMEKSIDETDNLKAKAVLNDLLDETNEKLEKGVELSQYDLEYMQKKYDLELARIALEEAQNAKSTVRLSRDNEGNFGYVYTADQDKIDDAQQNYEDKLYDIRTLSEEYIQEMSDLIIQNEQDLMDALASIDKTRFETKEEYEAEVERITKYYLDRDIYLRTELDKAVENSGKVYSDTILGQLENAATWEEAHNNLATNTNAATETMITEWGKWKDTTTDAMEEVGTSSEELTGYIEDDMEDIGIATDTLADDIDDQTQNMISYIGNLMDKVEDWRREYIQAIDDMIAANERLAGVESGGGTEDPMPTSPDPSESPAEEPQEQQEQTRSGSWSGAMEVFRAINGGGAPTGLNNRIAHFTKLGYTEDEVRAAQAYINEVYPKELKGKATEAAAAEKAVRERFGFATGGYTGEWGPEGKLAFLHEKELVLNKEDTANLLTSISFLRDIVSVIDSQASMASMFNMSAMAGVSSNTETLEQMVTIHAEFPNATNHSEIEEAFNNLVNRASQYANRK